MDNTSKNIALVSIVALGMLGAAGNIAPYILPIIVGGLVDYNGFSVQDASYAASSDMFGLGLGTFVWSRIMFKTDWRTAGTISGLFLFVGNLASASVGDFVPVLISRFIAGIGSGMVISICVSGLSTSSNPDRVIGIYAAAVTLVASVVLYTLPFILKASGSSSMFMVMSLFGLAAAIASRFIPNGQAGDLVKSETPSVVNEASSVTDSKNRTFVKWCGLFGIFFIFFGTSLFWVYLERVAVLAGFETSEISTILGISQVTGVAGAAFAAIVATKLGGRFIPLLIAVLLALGASLVLPVTTNFLYFITAGGALIFAWNMAYPYAVSLMVSLDSTAKLVAVSLFFMTLSKSLSPLFGSFLVTETDYTMAYWLCDVSFILAMLLFIPALRVTDVKYKKTKAADLQTDSKAA